MNADELEPPPSSSTSDAVAPVKPPYPAAGLDPIITAEMSADALRKTRNRIAALRRELDAMLDDDASLNPKARRLISRLAVALNGMAQTRDSLEAARAALAETEDKVRRRTSELTESNRLLAGMVDRRERMEQALRESEARTRAILDTAVDAIITIDERCTISTFNRAAERLFGYTSDEAVGQNISLLMPEPYAAEHDGYVARYVKTRVPKIIGIGREVTGRRKDGSVFPMDLAVSETRIGRLRLFTGIVRDLTERQRMENAIVDAAEGEQRRIGQDLHDGLSQQLAGIGFLASTLENRLHKENHSAAADAGRISSLLRDAIAQARGLARGLYPVEPQPRGLAHALKQLCENMRDAYKVDCRFIGESANLPPQFSNRSTATHLYRIAQEAVNNGIRHGMAKRLHLALADGAAAFTLRVRDYGVGLKEGTTDSSKPPVGIGMRTMAHRAHLIGGTLAVKPCRPGVEVTCRLSKRKATR